MVMVRFEVMVRLMKLGLRGGVRIRDNFYELGYRPRS